MLNNKLLNFGAVILFFWVAWTQYQYNSRNQAVTTAESSSQAQYVVTIDSKKKHEDYTWIEKLAYKFYGPSTKEVPAAKQEPKQAPLAFAGDLIEFDCISQGMKISWCNKQQTAKIGQGALPLVVEQGLASTSVGSTIRIGVPITAVNNSLSNDLIFCDFTVISITKASNVNTEVPKPKDGKAYE